MTVVTWWKGRSPIRGHVVAYSVRPDLWPPGAVRKLHRPNSPSDGHLADWDRHDTVTSVPAYGYAEPGALEAALASGDHVLVFSSVVDQEVVGWEVDP